MGQRKKPGCKRDHTGVKAIAWGLGLNEDALTFNLLTAAEEFPSAGCGPEGLPLNGGIAWMNIFGRLIGASGLAAGLVGVG